MTSNLWDFDRIAQMIRDGIEENLHLDYKSAASLDKSDNRKRDEIVKDVTAFANSDGGTLIYGISEFREKERRHLPEKIDPLIRTAISKEWLESMISRASPRIHGVSIVPVAVPGNVDGVIYVVEVPKSGSGHQSVDGRYYRRYNFESVFMQDHEIRDVMNRRTHPLVELRLILSLWPHDWRDPARSNLMWEIKNTSDVFCEHYALHMEVPVMFGNSALLFAEPHWMSDPDEKGECHSVVKVGNALRSPLFPRAASKGNIPVSLGRLLKAIPSGTILRAIVYADGAPPQHFEYDLSSITDIRYD